MVPEAWKEGLSGRCVCPFGPTPLASLIIPSLHLPDSQEVTESPDRKLGPTPKRRPEEKDLGQRKMQRHSHLTVLRTEGRVGHRTSPSAVMSQTPAWFSETGWFKDTEPPLLPRAQGC